MIYFAQLPTGAIKIGYASDVDQRMITLRREFNSPIAFLKAIPGGRREERATHERFAHLRFSGTEQFRPGLDLMEFIGCPLLVGANPDAVEAVEKDMAVRLELPMEDYQRLEKQARKLGLTKASYARMKVMQGLAADEREGSK